LGLWGLSPEMANFGAGPTIQKSLQIYRPFKRRKMPVVLKRGEIEASGF